MADGETGATGAHVVRHVGLGTASGHGDATVLHRVPGETLVWDFVWRASLAI